MTYKTGVMLLLAGLMALVISADKKDVKKVPVTPISPVSGAENYRQYCAACHGTAGRGDGPAASALTKTPGDLTLLAMRNNGTYPSDRVRGVLMGTATVAAHGNADMPVWGPLFRSMDAHDGAVNQRIFNLVKHLETLQRK